MTKDPLAFYTVLLEENNAMLAKLQGKIRRLSTMRIVGFLLALFFVYLFADSSNYWWLVAAVVMFVLFVAFVLHHQRLIAGLQYQQAKNAILQNELDALALRPGLFADGSRFTADLPFADDLDLFGKHSLFQLLNRCTTPAGEALLAKGLIHSSTDPLSIAQMQEAVKQLISEAEFRIEILTLMQQTRAEKFPDLEKIKAKKQHMLFNHWSYRVLRFALPALVIVSILTGLITGSFQFFSIAATFVLMVILGLAKKTSQLAAELDGLRGQLKTWAVVLAKFTKLEVRGDLLQHMQSNASEASVQMQQLSKLSEGFDRRANLIWFVLANTLFAYDLQLALRFEEWKVRHMHEVPEWLQTLARFEMILGVSAFAYNHPDYSWPILSPAFQLNATQLRHPLMFQNQCVANDVAMQIDPRVMLVTGSNMSGKSTWLRTLGVNLLLAQLGAPVSAAAFQWKPMRLLSSLRQTDSLSENTSLFMNELKQLKYILDTANKEYCLILLDEILRGTNSADKYGGSYALLKRLAKVGSLTVMATHDLKLSELEQELPGSLVNYCFESEIKQGKLLFDYTIRPGVAVNRNATWLMRDMGIIGE